mmetsp:Transcript_22019/g.36467  ORF Transcript_22019/g.36467 Transcript_22019/m.36467 type:complete len:174 (-) Transcript_22019:204-725(-)
MSYVDLLGEIDFSQITCLNSLKDKPITNAISKGLREQDLIQWQSDSDAQLLCSIPFQTAIRLHSIAIQAPSDGSAPASLKFFINRPNIGFDEASSETPVQEIQLTPENILPGAPPIQLKFVRFQTVQSLTIFIAENMGDVEQTCVQKLILYGVSTQRTNMSELKKVGAEAGGS